MYVCVCAWCGFLRNSSGGGGGTVAVVVAVASICFAFSTMVAEVVDEVVAVV